MNYCIVIPRLARDDEASYAFPIGIAYVSAALKATGRHVITYNFNYKKATVAELLSKLIEEYQIDVIASGGLTTQYPELREIFETAKQIKPDIITWVGGGIITASPLPAMEALEYADYGMIGEGDITICELAEAMEGKRELASVDGLIYRDPAQTGWIITNPRKEVEDLDQLPIPDYEGFEYEQAINKANFELNAEHSGMVAFSRSCPFNCTFCFHPSGTKYRKRSLPNILKEVDYLISNYHIKSLYISDELFALRKEELKAFCSAIKARNLTYMISLRVDMVDTEMLTQLKESGCYCVGFGLESADNTVLKSMNKHITVEQIERALQMCRDINLNTTGNFIFGDEAETVETYHNTLNWWYKHPQYSIKLGYISVYPGSILYQNACRRGLISNQVEYIRQGCPQINVSKLTDDEYRQMMLDISIAINKGTDTLVHGKVEYSQSGLGTIYGECPHCGHKNIWNDREIFRPLSKISCEYCKNIIDIHPVDYIDTQLYRSNFAKLSNHNIALWGIISSIEAIYQVIPEIWQENFILIDSAIKKQGLSLHGKMIYSPDAIISKHIEIVVITFTTTSAGSICSTIAEKYPNVKKILFLGDLLNKNFEL